MLPDFATLAVHVFPKLEIPTVMFYYGNLFAEQFKEPRSENGGIKMEKEKLELYEKYKDKIKLIQIDKNDINDPQNLEYNLYQELVELGWKPSKQE